MLKKCEENVLKWAKLELNCKVCMVEVEVVFLVVIIPEAPMEVRQAPDPLVVKPKPLDHKIIHAHRVLRSWNYAS